MTNPQTMILVILVLTMGLFLWGRFRHDVVALAALMACVLAGLVPAEDAFAGFGHPAVITVACVLVLSHGLQNSGAVDALARAVLPRESGRVATLGALVGLGALLSGFMNNVGALALLMPVAVQVSNRLDMAPGQVLMPLAFGTILGGMTTLVGTPPNLIVSSFRAEAGLGGFAMFDFAPIGLSVAVAGVAFVVLFGWRLIPARKPSNSEGFATGAYLTEVRVPAKSKAVGMTLRQIESDITAAEAQIVAIVRNDLRLTAPHGGRRVRADDILVLEADVESLAEALAAFDIKLEEQVGSDAGAAQADTGTDDKADAPGNNKTKSTKATPAKGHSKAERDAGDQDGADKDISGDVDIVLRELVVLPGASIVGQSASDLRLRTRYGLNLLAVSRHGHPPRARLRTLKLKAGDLLLMQGRGEILGDFANETGCVPLGARDLRLPDKRMAILSTAIMGAAIATVTLGLLPAAAAFALAVLASMVLRTVPLSKIYTAIDWPVVVLLAALIPVAGAMQSTGAAALLATFLLDTVAQGNAIAALSVILIVTMFLSDVMNNAATAAVMCPIALGIAASLGVSPDSFLMAVAIGASCAFLTPIGHQNNTLVLGPGGFGFGDYWRLGLPLEVIVVVVAIPMLLLVWPL